MTTVRLVSVIDSLPLLLRVGVHPWEKHDQRRNLVEVTVRLGTTVSAQEFREGAFIDYDPVFRYLKSLEDCEHVELIETIAIGIIDYTFDNLECEQIDLMIKKKSILPPTDFVGIELSVKKLEWVNEHT